MTNSNSKQSLIILHHQNPNDVIYISGFVKYIESTELELYDKIFLILNKSLEPLFNSIYAMTNIKGIFITDVVLNDDPNLIIQTKLIDIILQTIPNSKFKYMGIYEIFENKTNYHNLMKSDTFNFIDCFYITNYIPTDYKIEYFSYNPDIPRQEQYLYDLIQAIGPTYDIVCEPINPALIKSQNKFINLTNISTEIFNFVKIFENADQIHMSYGLVADVIYLLQQKYKLLQNKQIFFHKNSITNSLYKDDFYLDNTWTILE
jgi:hypothetical protein